MNFAASKMASAKWRSDCGRRAGKIAKAGGVPRESKLVVMQAFAAAHESLSEGSMADERGAGLH